MADSNDTGIRLPKWQLPGTLPEGWTLEIGDGGNPARRDREGLSVIRGAGMAKKKKPSGTVDLDAPISGRELGRYLSMIRKEMRQEVTSAEDRLRAEMDDRFDRVDRRLDQIARALRIDVEPG